MRWPDAESSVGQAYPTKQELAKAIRGQLGGAAGSKKLSRLKRVILRERSDKAAAAASVAATNAAAVAEHAEAARAAVVASFQVPLCWNACACTWKKPWGLLQGTLHARFGGES